MLHYLCDVAFGGLLIWAIAKLYGEAKRANAAFVAAVTFQPIPREPCPVCYGDPAGSCCAYCLK